MGYVGQDSSLNDANSTIQLGRMQALNNIFPLKFT